ATAGLSSDTSYSGTCRPRSVKQRAESTSTRLAVGTSSPAGGGAEAACATYKTASAEPAAMRATAGAIGRHNAAATAGAGPAPGCGLESGHRGARRGEGQGGAAGGGGQPQAEGGQAAGGKGAMGRNRCGVQRPRQISRAPFSSPRAARLRACQYASTIARSS